MGLFYGSPGIVRSSSGNLPYFLDRVAAHRKALYSVLPAGIARRHNTNQAAGIKVQNNFALPVLLSGIAALTLNTSEFQVLDKYFKQTLRSIMKLPDKTPDSVIYFLAGTLPIKAHVHRKQLSIFGMISRLPNNVLHKIATNVLVSDPDSSKSWFMRIRLLCTQYSLPSPLQILLNPPSKESFNRLVKSRILDYWETSLRSEALSKSSLCILSRHLCHFPSLTQCLQPAPLTPLKLTKVFVKQLYFPDALRRTTFLDIGVKRTQRVTV